MISHRAEETLDFTVCLQTLEDPKRRDDQVKTLPKVQDCDVRLLDMRSRERDPVLRQFLPAEREHGLGDIYAEDIAALLNKGKQDTASTAAQLQNSRRGRREPLLIEWDIVGKLRTEIVVPSCIFADVRSHYRLGAPNGLEIRGPPLWGSRPASQDQYRAKPKYSAGRDRSKIPGALRQAQGRLRGGGHSELLRAP